MKRQGSFDETAEAKKHRWQAPPSASPPLPQELPPGTVEDYPSFYNYSDMPSELQDEEYEEARGNQHHQHHRQSSIPPLAVMRQLLMNAGSSAGSVGVAVDDPGVGVGVGGGVIVPSSLDATRYRHDETWGLHENAFVEVMDRFEGERKDHSGDDYDDDENAIDNDDENDQKDNDNDNEEEDEDTALSAAKRLLRTLEAPPVPPPPVVARKSTATPVTRTEKTLTADGGEDSPVTYLETARTGDNSPTKQKAPEKTTGGGEGDPPLPTNECKKAEALVDAALDAFVLFPSVSLTPVISPSPPESYPPRGLADLRIELQMKDIPVAFPKPRGFPMGPYQQEGYLIRLIEKWASDHGGFAIQKGDPVSSTPRIGRRRLLRCACDRNGKDSRIGCAIPSRRQPEGKRAKGKSRTRILQEQCPWGVWLEKLDVGWMPTQARIMCYELSETDPLNGTHNHPLEDPKRAKRSSSLPAGTSSDIGSNNGSTEDYSAVERSKSRTSEIRGLYANSKRNHVGTTAIASGKKERSMESDQGEQEKSKKEDRGSSENASQKGGLSSWTDSADGGSGGISKVRTEPKEGGGEEGRAGDRSTAVHAVQSQQQLQQSEAAFDPFRLPRGPFPDEDSVIEAIRAWALDPHTVGGSFPVAAGELLRSGSAGHRRLLRCSYHQQQQLQLQQQQQQQKREEQDEEGNDKNKEAKKDGTSPSSLECPWGIWIEKTDSGWVPSKMTTACCRQSQDNPLAYHNHAPALEVSGEGSTTAVALECGAKRDGDASTGNANGKNDTEEVPPSTLLPVAEDNSAGDTAQTDHAPATQAKPGKSLAASATTSASAVASATAARDAAATVPFGGGTRREFHRTLNDVRKQLQLSLIPCNLPRRGSFPYGPFQQESILIASIRMWAEDDSAGGGGFRLALEEDLPPGRGMGRRRLIRCHHWKETECPWGIWIERVNVGWIPTKLRMACYQQKPDDPLTCHNHDLIRPQSVSSPSVVSAPTPASSSSSSPSRSTSTTTVVAKRPSAGIAAPASGPRMASPPIVPPVTSATAREAALNQHILARSASVRDTGGGLSTVSHATSTEKQASSPRSRPRAEPERAKVAGVIDLTGAGAGAEVTAREDPIPVPPENVGPSALAPIPAPDPPDTCQRSLSEVTEELKRKQIVFEALFREGFPRGPYRRDVGLIRAIVRWAEDPNTCGGAFRISVGEKLRAGRAVGHRRLLRCAHSTRRGECPWGVWIEHLDIGWVPTKMTMDCYALSHSNPLACHRHHNTPAGSTGGPTSSSVLVTSRASQKPSSKVPGGVPPANVTAPSRSPQHSGIPGVSARIQARPPATAVPYPVQGPAKVPVPSRVSVVPPPPLRRNLRDVSAELRRKRIPADFRSEGFPFGPFPDAKKIISAIRLWAIDRNTGGGAFKIGVGDLCPPCEGKGERCLVRCQHWWKTQCQWGVWVEGLDIGWVSTMMRKDCYSVNPSDPLACHNHKLISVSSLTPEIGTCVSDQSSSSTAAMRCAPEVFLTGPAAPPGTGAHTTRASELGATMHSVRASSRPSTPGDGSCGEITTSPAPAAGSEYASVAVGGKRRFVDVQKDLNRIPIHYDALFPEALRGVYRTDEELITAIRHWARTEGGGFEISVGELLRSGKNIGHRRLLRCAHAKTEDGSGSKTECPWGVWIEETADYGWICSKMTTACLRATRANPMHYHRH